MNDSLTKRAPVALSENEELRLRINEFRQRQLKLAISTLDVTETAQSFSQEALLTLAQIMNNEKKSASARIKAAQAILDRAVGRAPAGMDAQGPLLPDPEGMSDEQLEGQIMGLVRERRDLIERLLLKAAGDEDE